MEFTVWALAMFLIPLGSAMADEPKSDASPSSSSSPAPAVGPRVIESALPEGTPQIRVPTVLLPEPEFFATPAAPDPWK